MITAWFQRGVGLIHYLAGSPVLHPPRAVSFLHRELLLADRIEQLRLSRAAEVTQWKHHQQQRMEQQQGDGGLQSALPTDEGRHLPVVTSRLASPTQRAGAGGGSGGAGEPSQIRHRTEKRTSAVLRLQDAERKQREAEHTVEQLHATTLLHHQTHQSNVSRHDQAIRTEGSQSEAQLPILREPPTLPMPAMNASMPRVSAAQRSVVIELRYLLMRLPLLACPCIYWLNYSSLRPCSTCSCRLTQLQPPLLRLGREEDQAEGAAPPQPRGTERWCSGRHRCPRRRGSGKDGAPYQIPLPMR